MLSYERIYDPKTLADALKPVLLSEARNFMLQMPKVEARQRGTCDDATHCMRLYIGERQVNFKIYERAYHGSKFSGEWLRDLNLVVC